MTPPASPRSAAAHAPRKRFGQHFLRDPQILRDLVAAIRPRPGDVMAEIGPGLGALTRPLLAALPHLHVVELDRDLAARLVAEFPAGRLSVHAADALAFDFGQLPAPLRVVGNLPYNISTPLLFHLATHADRLQDLHFMLQKEVVDRIVAAPGTADYGRLGVMLQYRFACEALFAVPPEAFHPPPRVDSAVVRLVPRAPVTVAADEALFAEVVRRAFGQRRKTLRNSLAGFAAPEDFAALGLDPGRRAETLAVAEFVGLANRLAGRGPAG